MKENTVESLNQMTVLRRRVNLNADVHRTVYFVRLQKAIDFNFLINLVHWQEAETHCVYSILIS